MQFQTPPFQGFTNVRALELRNDDYHASPGESLSNTRLKVHRENPQDYYQQFITGEMPFKETDDLIFGRVAHEVILEPHTPITEHTYDSGTLAVFRPAEEPKRKPDVYTGTEKIWIQRGMTAGVFRTSEVWGDLEGDDEDPCCWLMTKEGATTGFCSFEDFHQNKHAFTHIPDSVLSSSGSRAGKKWTEFKDGHGGVLYKSADWVKILSMRREIRAHQDAWDLLYNNTSEESYRTEFSIFGMDVATGLEMRCRIDRMKKIDGKMYVIDLKTSRDANPWKWQKQADTDGLATQAFIMKSLVEELFGLPVEYRYVVCDKEPSYRVEVFKVPDEFLEIGRDDYMRGVTRFKKSLDTWNWYPATHGKTVTLTVPEYRMKEEQDHKVHWADDGDESEVFADANR